MALLLLTACSPDEQLLWKRWFAEDPVAAMQNFTVPTGEEVLTPVLHAALEAHVTYLESLPDTPRDLGVSLTCQRYGCDAFAAIDWIISRESNWQPDAYNSGSGACGLPQALPCSKLPGYPYDWAAQLAWMFDYIDARYNGPWGAVAWWRAHGWY